MADLQTMITHVQEELKFLQSLMTSQGGQGGQGDHQNKLLPPWCITGAASIFGLNWDGSDDEGDEDSHGVPLKGAWGEETHNKTLVGCAMPIRVIKAMFGSTHKPNVTVEIYSQATEKTIKCEMCDLGPAARIHRPIDLTYAAHTALGHIEYGLAKFGSFEHFPSSFPVTFWVEDPNTGEAIEIKGWNFQSGRVIGS